MLTLEQFPIPPGIMRNGSNTLALSVFTYNTTAVDDISAGMEVQVDSYTGSCLDLPNISVESPTWSDVFQQA